MAEKIPERQPDGVEKADLKHIEQMAADLGAWLLRETRRTSMLWQASPPYVPSGVC